MKRHGLTNLPASVHQRLLNMAHQTKRPFSELFQYFVIERFLFRLSRSRHAKQFVLKGALMLRIWDLPAARPTRDIDMLGRRPISVDALVQVVQECLAAEVPDDGLHFDPQSVHGTAITLDAKYQGARVLVRGLLGTARVTLQVDFGFGDIIVPKPIPIDYPELLDFGQPHLLGYTPESVVAEKFQAMVELDMANTRMKDFFDVWALSQNLEFDGTTLCKAIGATFNKRETPLPISAPPALTPSFSADRTKQAQWSAFVRKARLDSAKTLVETIGELAGFILPAALASAEGKPFKMQWTPDGGWS
jgi:hypothetical protein